MLFLCQVTNMLRVAFIVICQFTMLVAEIEIEKPRIFNFENLMVLTLTLNWVI